MIDRITFSERLKCLRTQNNQTMVDIANALNINKTSVFTWESTKTIPTADKLLELANHFDVSIDYLIGRTDNPKVNE